MRATCSLVMLRHHARRLVAAGPDQRAPGLDVAALDAVRDLRRQGPHERGAATGHGAGRQGTDHEPTAGQHRDKLPQSLPSSAYEGGRSAGGEWVCGLVFGVSRSLAASGILPGDARPPCQRRPDRGVQRPGTDGEVVSRIDGLERHGGGIDRGAIVQGELTRRGSHAGPAASRGAGGGMPRDHPRKRR